LLEIASFICPLLIWSVRQQSNLLQANRFNELLHCLQLIWHGVLASSKRMLPP